MTCEHDVLVIVNGGNVTTRTEGVGAAAASRRERAFAAAARSLRIRFTSFVSRRSACSRSAISCACGLDFEVVHGFAATSAHMRKNTKIDTAKT
jgi:hypothetical protein